MNILCPRERPVFQSKLGVSSSNQCNLHHSPQNGHLENKNKKREQSFSDTVYLLMQDVLPRSAFVRPLQTTAFDSVQRDSEGHLSRRNFVRKTAVSKFNSLTTRVDTAWIFGVSLEGRTEDSGYNIRTKFWPFPARRLFHCLKYSVMRWVSLRDQVASLTEFYSHPVRVKNQETSFVGPRT